MNYNYNFINQLIDNGFQVELKKTQKINEDGTSEFGHSLNFCRPKYQQRSIVNVKTERRVETINDYDIRTEINCFETGIIFKDKHYYRTQFIIPKTNYIIYEREVTYYSDNTVNYGDWRRLN